MSLRPLLVPLPLIWALCACQQAAWKAGASADDLQRDQQACRARASGDDAASRQCLREKGWTVAEPGAALDNNDTVPASAPAPKRAPSDPLQKQSVQTWWKAGAQAADFNTDANTCAEQLGAQHTPDFVKHLYTRALVNCLHARGWFAGQDPAYTPLR